MGLAVRQHSSCVGPDLRPRAGTRRRHHSSARNALGRSISLVDVPLDRFSSSLNEEVRRTVRTLGNLLGLLLGVVWAPHRLCGGRHPAHRLEDATDYCAT